MTFFLRFSFFLFPFAAAGALASKERSALLLVAFLSIAFAAYWRGFALGAWQWSPGRILIAGLLARIALFPLQPCDDIHRYFWEARVLLAGFNPYALAPDSSLLAYLRDANWPLINHPSIAAIYPPVAQALFVTLTVLTAPVRWLGLEGGLIFSWALKFAMSACDVVSFTIIRRLATHSPASAAAPALFFLNPLLILEGAGRGHFESLLLLCMLALLLSLQQNRSLWAGVWMTTAALVKPIALALWPIMAIRFRPSHWWIAILAPTITAFAILIAGGDQTLIRFGTDFRFNTALPWLIDSLGNALGWGDPTWLARAGFAVCAVAGFFRFRRSEPSRMALFQIGNLLLWLPTVHPWYILWILPFASLHRSLPWVLLSGSALSLYFVTWHAAWSGVWREPEWMRWAVYLPPLTLWITMTALASKWLSGVSHERRT